MSKCDLQLAPTALFCLALLLSYTVDAASELSPVSNASFATTLRTRQPVKIEAKLEGDEMAWLAKIKYVALHA